MLIDMDFNKGGSPFFELVRTVETITGTVTSDGLTIPFNNPSAAISIHTKRGSVTTQPTIQLFYSDGTVASNSVYMSSPNADYTVKANSPLKIVDSIIIKVISGSNFALDTAEIDYVTPQ